MDPLASSDAARESPVVTDQGSSAVWSPVLTLLWTGLIAIVFVVVQIVAAVAYTVATVLELSHAKVEAALAGLKFDGIFLSLCTFATLLICTPLVVGIMKLKRGSKLKDYLGLIVPRPGQLWRWSLVTIAYCVITPAILSLLHQSKAWEFMLKVYSSANPRWLIWLALVICAPVFEEIAFRGFLFKGLAASRLRWYGATVVTSVLWAVIHLQYDWYEISGIFVLGLVLGTARAMTNSILLTIWLHCLVNALATAEMALAFRQMQVNN